MIMAITEDGIVRHKILDTYTNSENFIEFLEEILKTRACTEVNLVTGRKKRFLLYLDNASIHVSKKVKEFLTKEGVEVIYGVPFTPQFNIIEKFFEDIKIAFYDRLFHKR